MPGSRVRVPPFRLIKSATSACRRDCCSLTLSDSSSRNPHYILMGIGRDELQRQGAVPMVAVTIIELEVRLERSGRVHVEAPRAPWTIFCVGFLEGRLHRAEQLSSRQFGLEPIRRFPTVPVALEPHVDQVREPIEFEVRN